MRFRANRYIYIRRITFVILIVLTALFQHSGLMPSIFGAPAMLLVPLTVCIAMYERSMAGICYGILAGALWDFAAVNGDGFYGVMLTCIGFFSGVFVTLLFRNNIKSASVMGFCSLLIFNVSHWLMFILRKGYEDSFSALVSFYLPSVLYSMVFVFVYYKIVSLIVKVTSPKKNIS